MEIPVFKLEGVFKSVDAPDFEGPLTLILQLLSKNKIEIRDISISLILEQYLDHLDKMAALDLDIASEFVAMASHLTYIKTKMLLMEGQEVSELEQLISSLEDLQRGDIYLQIKEAATLFSDMYLSDGAMMSGPPEYLPVDNEYVYSHEREDLMNAILRVIGREDARIQSKNPREMVYPKRIVYSIPEKITEILGRLKIDGVMSVNALFYESESRTELIATFVAILELCKTGSVLLTGDEDDMEITYTGTGRQPDMAELEVQEASQ